MGRIFEAVDMGKNVIKSYCNEIHKNIWKIEIKETVISIQNWILSRGMV